MIIITTSKDNISQHNHMTQCDITSSYHALCTHAGRGLTPTLAPSHEGARSGT